MLTTTFDFVKIVVVSTIILIAVILLVNYRTTMLKHQLTDLRIRLLINLREQAVRYQLLMDQFKNKSNKSHALDELQHIFGDKISALRRQFPALTELDVQVLILIGLGVDNYEILQFMDMSKRTYYKRRQLIAQRMNTTAAQLDTLAKQLFAPNV